MEFFFFGGDLGDVSEKLVLRSILLNGVVMNGEGRLVGRKNWGMVVD